MSYIDSSSKGGGGGGLSGFFSNNSGLLAGLGGGLAGLIPSLFGNNSGVPYAQQQQDVIGRLGGVGANAGQDSSALFGEGQGLLNPLISGQLPSGAQSVVDQLVQKQTADTKAKYASLGQTGSTMEQSALNDINTNKGALTFQIAQQMAQTGLQATGQSLQALGIEDQAYGEQGQLYGGLMNAQMKQDSNLFASIGSFASAFSKALPAIAAA